MTAYVNVTKRAICGDAGNPSIIIFVRDFRGLDLHYNTTLQHHIPTSLYKK